MPDDTYTTLLSFLSDSSSAQKDIDGLTGSMKKAEEQAKKLSGFQPAKLSTGLDYMSVGVMNELRKIETASKKLGVTMSQDLQKAFRTGSFSDKDLDELYEVIKVVDQFKDAQEEATRQAVQASRTRASLYSRESSIIRKTVADIQQTSSILKNQAAQIQGISQIGLALGTGVVGGIFAFATKYVSSAKEATATTMAWKAAQDSLKESGDKVGAVFAQEALPLLQQAADLASKAAGFIEKHPDIIRAALNTGMVVAGLSAVGMAVSKGIKIYADQMYLATIPMQLEAGRLQFAAAQEQLVAARMKAGAGGVSIPTGGGTPQTVPGMPMGNVLGTIGKITLVATSVIIGAELGLALGNAIAKLIDPNAKNMTMKETLFYGGIRAIEAIEQKFANMLLKIASAIPDVLGGKALRDFANFQLKWTQTTDKFFYNLLIGTDKVVEASKKLEGVQSSPKFQEVLSAYEKYREQDMELVRRHYSERQKVIDDSMSAEARSNSKLASSSEKVRFQLGKSLSEATKSYEEQARKDEAQFARERAQIVRDGSTEIQRIEQDLQERLRKLQFEHSDKVEELTAARNALGLAKEQQRYAREQGEEVRQTNVEISRRRQDLAIRLQDLTDNYQQERAQRLVEYKSRVAEIQANASEQLKELQDQHQAELNEIRLNRNQRLREMDVQFNEERKRQYNAFIAQVRDLDASLIGEKNLRAKRQAEMIVDLDKFLLQYKQKMGTLLTAPQARAGGGYASYGTYLLGDTAAGGRGKSEYVMGGDLTELAERVLGGRISQGKMAAVLQAFGGKAGNNVVYNDSRRIDSRISNADRQRLIDDTLEAVAVALSG